MRSMTGFGRATAQGATYGFTVEARSVNHRFLEVGVRVRDPFREAESVVRSVVAESVARGRVDVSVDVEPLGEDPAGAVRLRHATLLELARSVAELAGAYPELGLAPASWGDLLRLPEVVAVDRQVVPWTDADRAALRDACVGAVDAMVAARSREGQALAAVVTGLAGELRALVESVAADLPRIREQLAERACTRLRELLSGQPAIADASAGDSWLGEALAHAERSDVTEEVDRLRTHLDHLVETCGGAGPAGRRLDFLAQELLRELQTLSAKCRTLEIAERVLHAKVITERLREQVQNVE